jgi:hypothetical protein
MRNKKSVVQQEPLQSYIQPSRDLAGQPAHVVQDGWIAYFTLPSYQHAHPSSESSGRGFFKGQSTGTSPWKKE